MASRAALKVCFARSCALKQRVRPLPGDALNDVTHRSAVSSAPWELTEGRMLLKSVDLLLLLLCACVSLSALCFRLSRGERSGRYGSDGRGDDPEWSRQKEGSSMDDRPRELCDEPREGDSPGVRQQRERKHELLILKRNLQPVHCLLLTATEKTETPKQ